MTDHQATCALEFGGALPSQLFIFELERLLGHDALKITSNGPFDLYSQLQKASKQHRSASVTFHLLEGGLHALDEIVLLLDNAGLYFRYTLTFITQTGVICSKVNEEGVFHLTLVNDKPMFSFDELKELSKDNVLDMNKVQKQVHVAYEIQLPALQLPK
ncbi:hypothetical protein ACQU0X_26575 [Pseudovibrio ascidiaceicola]|uniref:hypothetical protein n=1 Tax=Pseudovibrio ascidiaceicola TaxID=285279 RepID=UPI003D367C8F